MSQNHSVKEKDIQAKEKFKDCLTFADVENQSFLELLETECFRPAADSPSDDVSEKWMNTDCEDNMTTEQKVQFERFIPYFTKDYNVLFGGSNYFVFLRCLFTMYERIRLVRKIVADKVNEDYKYKKEEVLHAYKGYIKSKERVRESHGVPKDGGINSTSNDLDSTDESVIKAAVTKQRLAILIGFSITRYKSKLDGSTFEDLVRIFLGIKAFFFFTFDKLIHTTNKAFQSLISDEYLKSNAFRMFKKYNTMKNHQRENLYLSDYKNKLAEMSSVGGYTTRLIYSPKSKIL